jgi:hypothetical protein
MRRLRKLIPLLALLSGCTLTGPAKPTDFGNGIIADTFTALYHVLPASDATAKALPYWQDSFCPAAFFLKSNLPPQDASHVPAGYPMAGFGNNGGFGIIDLQTDSCLVGTVKGVEPLCVGTACTWNHNTFYVAPDDSTLLNSMNVNYANSWAGMGDTIKCYTPASMTTLPAIGGHVKVCGPFGPSTTWCGTTIQPVYWWEAL